MKETRIQRGKKGHGCSRQSGEQHRPANLGTHPGNGAYPRASPFHKLLKVNSSYHFEASLSNCLLVSF